MVHARRRGIVCRTGLGLIIAAGPPMDPAVSRIYAPFYSSAFTWNYALGMTQLLIPLYARELGYSGVAIGSLIALPIIVQMVFNLIGGAGADRVGGMNNFPLAVAGPPAGPDMFVAVSSFPGPVAAPMLMIAARPA